MRRPYTSQWRLFRNDPTRLTKGRFVIVPWSTPCAPFPINTWSRNWTKGKTLITAVLGEVEDGPQPYAPDPILTLPSPILLGTRDCVENGERWPLPVLVRQYVEGFDRRCYPPGPSGPGPIPAQIDVLECLTQRKLIQILDQMYLNINTAQATLEAWLDGVVVAAVPNSTSVVPGTLIGTWGDALVILVSGTTNFQQWAAQAMFGSQGVANYGTYGTLPFWQDAADQISLRIDAVGWAGTGPVVIAGHSYGGAVSCLLALRARVGLGADRVSLFTIGCPKPGDQRLINLINPVRQSHLVNDDDPIPHIPPSGAEIAQYRPISGFLNLTRWLGWVRPGPQVGVRADGVRAAVPAAVDMYNLIARMIFQFISWGRLDVITAHLSGEYYRRCVCPLQPAPGPSPWSADLWLRSDGLLGYHLGDVAENWLPTENTPRNGRHESGVDGNVMIDPSTQWEGVLTRWSEGVADHWEFEPIDLPADWTIYVVARQLTGVNGPALNFAAATWFPLAVSGSGLRAADLVVGFDFGDGVAPTPGLLEIYSSRRRGAEWQLWR